MNKFYLILFSIFSSFITFSQNTITFKYEARDVVSQRALALDSVHIINVTANCDTILYDSVSFLSVNTFWPVGINESKINYAGEFLLNQNYPNPFYGNTSVNLYRDYSGPMNLMLFDAFGRKLADYQSNFEKGFHSFKISSSGFGVLILVVSDNKNNKSIRIISSGSEQGKSSIQYIGYTPVIENRVLKSNSKSNFIFHLGEQMLYIAYAKGFNDTMTADRPYTDATYIFDMSPKKSSFSITTDSITYITQYSAYSGGSVTLYDDLPITAKGVCWSETSGPLVSGYHTMDGSGTDPFESSITGLSPSTLYYVRSYVINSAGTFYGNETSFTTAQLIEDPLVVSIGAWEITLTTAKCGGFAAIGAVGLTARGVCWSTGHNPDISDNHTNDGASTGWFFNNITGLTKNTTYYERAYVTTSTGTSYGLEFSFKTLETTPFEIGQNYGGGIIFYVNPSGFGGLICPTYDQCQWKEWVKESYIITNATGSAIGTGMSNTNKIVSTQGRGEGSYVAEICNDLVLGGYYDWYLPSKDELNLMYTNLRLSDIGNLSNYYWSSTEFNLENAWYQQFNTGTAIWGDKAAYGWMSARAVRSFDSLSIKSLATAITSEINYITQRLSKNSNFVYQW